MNFILTLDVFDVSMLFYNKNVVSYQVCIAKYKIEKKIIKMYSTSNYIKAFIFIIK